MGKAHKAAVAGHSESRDARDWRAKLMMHMGAQMAANDYQALAMRTEFTPDFVRLPQRRLRGLASATIDERQLARLMHGMMGACTETGELQDAVKKGLIYGKAFDKVNVVEECGDLLWYIALCLDAVGSDMQTAMERNIEKLTVRFPKKFTQQRAKRRDLTKERSALEAKPQTKRAARKRAPART